MKENTINNDLFQKLKEIYETKQLSWGIINYLEPLPGETSYYFIDTLNKKIIIIKELFFDNITEDFEQIDLDYPVSQDYFQEKNRTFQNKYKKNRPVVTEEVMHFLLANQKYLPNMIFLEDFIIIDDVEQIYDGERHWKKMNKSILKKYSHEFFNFLNNYYFQNQNNDKLVLNSDRLDLFLFNEKECRFIFNEINNFGPKEPNFPFLLIDDDTPTNINFYNLLPGNNLPFKTTNLFTLKTRLQILRGVIRPAYS